MNKIQIFKNEQFGQIRTVVNESGEPMFAATDVCNALGYSNSRKAIADHTVQKNGVTFRYSVVEK